MFSFFKKSTSDPWFPFTTDIHSHILPGIDDGSPDVETSIALIKGLKQLGIKRSIATPHIIGDMYRNNRDTIFSAKQGLELALKHAEIDFELDAAAEYMLDNYFLDLLASGERLLTIKDNILLTEFSYASPPSHPQKMSFAIQTEGYEPILAHPERYGYYHNNYNFYHQLKDLGFALQVNLLSLTGYYGKPVAKAAAYILKNNLATYLATDLHHQRHMDALLHFLHDSELRKLIRDRDWNASLST